MSVRAKTAIAAWVTLFGAGCAFAAFGMSDDSDSGLRDTLIELRMLKSEPTNQYIEFCAAREKLKFNWELRGGDLKALEEAAGAPVLDSNLSVRIALWCPMPEPPQQCGRHWPS